jgi:alkylation response protein AidB-like acyl-CoA dehydrogenase
MASGEVLGAYGLTEPRRGIRFRRHAHHGHVQDGADGGTWIIDGGKRFITNAGQAGTYIVAGRTGTREDGSPRSRRSSSRADTPGFSSAGWRRSSASTHRYG